MTAAGPSYREVTVRAAWSDVKSTAGFALVTLIGVALASVARNTTEGFDQDVRAVLGGVPHTVIHIALVTLQVALLALLVGTPIALALRRRPGLLVRGTLGAVLGAGAFLAFSQLGVLQNSGSALAPVSTAVGPGPSSLLIAATAAVVATLQPVTARRWLAPAWTALIVLAVLRTLSAPDAPLDVVFAIGLGGVVGSLVLLGLGRSVHVLTPDGVARVLEGVHLPVTRVEQSDTPNDGWPLVALGPGGRPLQIRVVDELVWDRDSRERAYRRFRLRDPGDETAHASPSRAVTSEAMVMLLARERGVRLPQVRAVGRAQGGQAILAVDALEGTALDELAPERLTDEVLTDAWAQVAALHAMRMAHHDLRLHHLVLDGAGQVWLTNLARGEVGASDIQLDGDIAELLAASYAVVGAERAVAPALAAVGPERLTAAAARLVPAVLSSPTRASVKERGLDPLLDEVARACGTERPQLVAVERFTPRTLLMAAALALAVYFLAPQVANVPRMIEALQTANWLWLPLVAAASVATYVGSGFGLAGGTPGRVPPMEAGAVALAGSFVATFSPPGASTVGLNTRFLQKRGLPLAVAIAASTAKEAATFVAHLAMLVVFALWAGSSGALRDEMGKLPPTHVLLLIGLGLAAVIGAAFAVPRVRELLRERVRPALREAAEAMRPVISDPVKIVQLLGGVVLVPLGYALCLWASVRAFDSSAGIAEVALVSLTAGAIASAAPTPGGIGAVEAVLLAALTAIGIPAAPALTGVLLYRLATFWLPIPPGFAAFRVMTARGIL